MTVLYAREFGTHKTVKAIFWPGLPGLDCSLYAWRRMNLLLEEDLVDVAVDAEVQVDFRDRDLDRPRAYVERRAHHLRTIDVRP